MRVHTGLDADRWCRQLGAEAFSCGARVYFRLGRYDPDSPDGLALLAHETAHVVQQARPGSGRSQRVLALEEQAEQAAQTFVSGTAALSGAGRVVVSNRPSTLIQRYASHEHRMLGDLSTEDLLEICSGGARSGEILNGQLRMLELWRRDPGRVTEEQLLRLCPDLLLTRVGPDRVLVTNGELNELPDFFANPAAMAQLPARILVPVLQTMRQGEYHKLRELAGERIPQLELTGFRRALGPETPISMVNSFLTMLDLERVTRNLGARGEDHYHGLLARNASHFAPFSWYRWQSAHERARDLAVRAHAGGRDPELTRAALLTNGYANHFLQDSLAAGHLVNKTLVMQWFVEWLLMADRPGDLVESAIDLLDPQRRLSDTDLAALRAMRLDLQPDLAGQKLYDPGYRGIANDPQTVLESTDHAARMTGAGLIYPDDPAGVGPDGDARAQEVYQSWLTFLSNTATQTSSATVHDHLNRNSLLVSSAAHPQVFRIWGDGTLLTKGAEGLTGVAEVSEATRRSDQAIQELLTTGATEISVSSIRGRLPDWVASRQETNATPSGEPGEQRPLRDWALGQREFCVESVWDRTAVLEILAGHEVRPRLGRVSQDQLRVPRNWSYTWLGQALRPWSRRLSRLWAFLRSRLSRGSASRRG